MVLILKDESDIPKIKKALAERGGHKKFDAKKFCGKVKFDEDAVVLQRRLRDEWR